MSWLRNLALVGKLYIAAGFAYAKEGQTLPDHIAEAKVKYSEFTKDLKLDKLVSSVLNKLYSLPSKEFSLTTKLEECVTVSGGIKRDVSDKVKIVLSSTTGPESASIMAIDRGNLGCFDSKDVVKEIMGEYVLNGNLQTMITQQIMLLIFYSK